MGGLGSGTQRRSRSRSIKQIFFGSKRAVQNETEPETYSFPSSVCLSKSLTSVPSSIAYFFYLTCRPETFRELAIGARIYFKFKSYLVRKFVSENLEVFADFAIITRFISRCMKPLSKLNIVRKIGPEKRYVAMLFVVIPRISYETTHFIV